MVTNQTNEIRPIDAVAFDLDGLMFNTEDIYDEVLDAILQKRGCQFSRQLKLQMMGLPGVQAVGVMIDACNLDDEPQALLDEAHELMAELMPGRIQPMPGLLPLLDLIEQVELPKSIATSSSPKFARTALSITGLLDRFKFVLTAENVAEGKPSPDIYLESARRHGVEPARMLILEDSLVGSRAAAASGGISIAVPGHHSVEQDFSHVDFQFGSLAEPRLQQMIQQRSVAIASKS